jgi:hypothetical protein
VPRFTLPDNPNLEWLRKQAKRIRDGVAARDPEALELLGTYDPPVADTVSLARAQRVLARAFGFADWPALRAHLAVIEHWTRRFDEPADAGSDADRFLRLACLDYARYDRAAPAAARDLLAAHPQIATACAATMAVCGRSTELAALLDADPATANAETGPYRWSPLLYLAYSRLADPGDVLGCVAVLLEHGADPDAGFLWNGLTSPFTVLTGAFGGGERAEPPHPHGPAIARLLLAAGADPHDNQTLYNRMFTPVNDYLEVLFEFGLGTDRPSPWRNRLGTEAYPTVAGMIGEQLRSAAEHGFTERIALLLAHGVDPNTTGYHPILGDQNAYEVAVRSGQTAAAELLAAAGGRSDRLTPVDRFVAAALAADGPAVRSLLAADSSLADAARRDRPGALVEAVALGHDDAVALLLDLGFAVDSVDRFGTTALHEAAHLGATATVEELLAAGADPGIRERRFDATPADWAAHGGHPELAAHLRLEIEGSPRRRP